MKRSIISAALIIAMLPFPAVAQMGQCGLRDSVVKELTGKYHEEKILILLPVSHQTYLEVYMTRDGGTWTILETFPNGVSCVRYIGSESELVGARWLDPDY